jgi:superfamily II DNA or RNA helicase
MEPLELVSCRSRLWRVINAHPGTDCVVVRLSPENGGGRAVSLITPFDRLQRVPTRARPRKAHRRSVARAIAATLLDAHPWASVPTALEANIRILPFQLEPALALLRGDCTRMLLADDVGLGKTIQAGLVVSELIARHEAERVLIVTPAGLREQWQRELQDRFGLPVTWVDAASLAQAGRALPPWIDSWSVPGVSLVSVDLVKRPEVLGQLANVLWDLLIVDEAHHAGQPSERRDAVCAIAGRARYLVMLTATPHGGDSGAFERLREIGQTYGEAAPVRVFRRDRIAAGLPDVGRRARCIRVRLTNDERLVQSLLDRYTRRVWREAGSGSAARLAMIVLRKRALSSLWSLARSLERRLAALGEPAGIDTQLSLAFDDTDGESIPDDHEALEAMGTPGLADMPAERQLLEALRVRAQAAHGSGACEAKLRMLQRALTRSSEPVIIFTEYRDTLQHIARHLHPAARVVCLHGGLLPAAREAAIDAFARGSARVLLATDAAGEGLNLQARCRWVIHFELPWSATRLAQRAGRVDRIGQPRAVHVWSLVAAETDEERVLERLGARDAVGEEEIARAIFDGAAWRPRASRRTAAGRAGGAEASRLELLAPLKGPAVLRPTRPLAAVVRRRGAFAAFGAGHLLMYAADLIDAAGRRVARESAGLVAASVGPAADRLAAAVLGGRLRRSVAAYRSFSRRARARDGALAACLDAASAGAVQPSLFDRRASQAMEQADSAANRSREELRAHARSLERADERLSVACRLIASIRVR